MSAPVAVVIPVWDSYVRWLDEAVRSVLAQDVGAEVIVVDNASEVPVPEIEGVTVVRAGRRLTTGSARNLGLDAVSAPFVVFLDADDIMLPGSLAALVEEIAARPDVGVFAMAILEGETGRRHRSPRWLARTLAPRRTAFALANSVWSLLPTQGATILRTADVAAAGGYADRMQGEDWALGVSMAWRGRVHFSARPALVYRWRDDSPGRGGSRVQLIANARCARERLREDPAVPSWAGRAAPALAPAQWAAIVAVRPVVRCARRLRDFASRQR